MICGLWCKACSCHGAGVSAVHSAPYLAVAYIMYSRFSVCRFDCLPTLPCLFLRQIRENGTHACTIAQVRTHAHTHTQHTHTHTHTYTHTHARTHARTHASVFFSRQTMLIDMENMDFRLLKPTCTKIWGVPTSPCVQRQIWLEGLRRPSCTTNHQKIPNILLSCRNERQTSSEKPKVARGKVMGST